MDANTLPKPNIDLYLDLMEELKARLTAVYDTTDLMIKDEYYIHKNFAGEFVFLQLRFICELLALGCIAVHADIKSTAQLRKHWNAYRIIGEFEKLKPNFFPIASASAPSELPGIKHEMNDVFDGTLTKKRFLKMYHLCGENLHAGNFKTRTKKQQKTFLIDDFIRFGNELQRLLVAHYYKLHDDEMIFRVLMNPEGTQKISYSVMIKTNQPVPSPDKPKTDP